MSSSNFRISATLPVVSAAELTGKVLPEICQSGIGGLVVDTQVQMVIKGRLVPGLRLEVDLRMLDNERTQTTTLGKLAMTIAKLISLPQEAIVYARIPLAD